MNVYIGYIRGAPLLSILVALMIAMVVATPTAAQSERDRSPASAASDRPQEGKPAVYPNPQEIEYRGGPPVKIPDTVRIEAADRVDEDAIRDTEQIFEAAGAQVVQGPDEGRPGRGGKLTVFVGQPENDPRVEEALSELGVEWNPELPAEGYMLASGKERGRSMVVLAGSDADGTFYAAQSLRQIVVDGPGPHDRVAGVEITDDPSMDIRGTIEGFYGDPWSQRERLDQMDFYGDTKMNTYIYAPKDDPYHREQWREPYPADRLAELEELVARADRNHVDFTFALSPGVSICYSRESDYEALEAKLQEMYDIGVRSFNIPLDDIDYTQWNCAGDGAEYGPPSREAAARAQVDLLNRVQQEFIETHEGVERLQMVPTEYGDLEDSPYKQVFREELDDEIVVQWTGTAVVPPEITNEQAREIEELYGHDVLLWDNYPVNDFAQTAGRLLLAPYQEREAGLSDNLSGIVSNPMNQAAASKVALFTIADFTWNDADYEPYESWRGAAEYLANGDEEVADALLAFFDLNHLAPTFGPDPWLPQSPVLSEKIGAFWRTYEAGEEEQAIAELRPYANLIAESPDIIRSGVDDELFLRDAGPWLEATELWGEAMTKSLELLEARNAGDTERASELEREIESLVEQAQKVESIPGENREEGVVKIGDGVLDEFIEEALAEDDR